MRAKGFLPLALALSAAPLLSGDPPPDAPARKEESRTLTIRPDPASEGKGIRYNVADERTNAKAERQLREALLGKRGIEEMFSKAMVCGPLLWDALKGDPAAKPLEDAVPANLQIQIPMTRSGKPVPQQGLSGRVIQSPEDAKDFWKAFSARFRCDMKTVIRKLDDKELAVYWATIPFDIEDPVFMVEAGASRILVDLEMEGDKATVFWMDDLTGLSIDEAKAAPAKPPPTGK